MRPSASTARYSSAASCLIGLQWCRSLSVTIRRWLTLGDVSVVLSERGCSIDEWHLEEKEGYQVDVVTEEGPAPPEATASSEPAISTELPRTDCCFKAAGGFYSVTGLVSTVTTVHRAVNRTNFHNCVWTRDS